jgi:hypothetical protein
MMFSGTPSRASSVGCRSGSPQTRASLVLAIGFQTRRRLGELGNPLATAAGVAIRDAQAIQRPRGCRLSRRRTDGSELRSLL